MEIVRHIGWLSPFQKACRLQYGMARLLPRISSSHCSFNIQKFIADFPHWKRLGPPYLGPRTNFRHHGTAWWFGFFPTYNALYSPLFKVWLFYSAMWRKKLTQFCMEQKNNFKTRLLFKEKKLVSFYLASQDVTAYKPRLLNACGKALVTSPRPLHHAVWVDKPGCTGDLTASCTTWRR